MALELRQADASDLQPQQPQPMQKFIASIVVIRSDGSDGQRYVLDERNWCVIGSHPECDIIVHSPGAAILHALVRIKPFPDGPALVGLDKDLPTVFPEKKIALHLDEGARLESGSVFYVGNRGFRFEIAQESSSHSVSIVTGENPSSPRSFSRTERAEPNPSKEHRRRRHSLLVLKNSESMVQTTKTYHVLTKRRLTLNAECVGERFFETDSSNTTQEARLLPADDKVVGLHQTQVPADTGSSDKSRTTFAKSVLPVRVQQVIPDHLRRHGALEKTEKSAQRSKGNSHTSSQMLQRRTASNETREKDILQEVNEVSSNNSTGTAREHLLESCSSATDQSCELIPKSNCMAKFVAVCNSDVNIKATVEETKSAQFPAGSKQFVLQASQCKPVMGLPNSRIPDTCVPKFENAIFTPKRVAQKNESKPIGSAKRARTTPRHQHSAFIQPFGGDDVSKRILFTPQRLSTQSKRTVPRIAEREKSFVPKRVLLSGKTDSNPDNLSLAVQRLTSKQDFAENFNDMKDRMRMKPARNDISDKNRVECESAALPRRRASAYSCENKSSTSTPRSAMLSKRKSAATQSNRRTISSPDLPSSLSSGKPRSPLNISARPAVLRTVQFTDIELGNGPHYSPCSKSSSICGQPNSSLGAGAQRCDRIIEFDESNAAQDQSLEFKENTTAVANSTVEMLRGSAPTPSLRDLGTFYFRGNSNESGLLHNRGRFPQIDSNTGGVQTPKTEKFNREIWKEREEAEQLPSPAFASSRGNSTCDNRERDCISFLHGDEKGNGGDSISKLQNHKAKKRHSAPTAGKNIFRGEADKSRSHGRLVDSLVENDSIPVQEDNSESEEPQRLSLLARFCSIASAVATYPTSHIVVTSEPRKRPAMVSTEETNCELLSHESNDFQSAEDELPNVQLSQSISANDMKYHSDSSETLENNSVVNISGMNYSPALTSDGSSSSGCERSHSSSSDSPSENVTPRRKSLLGRAFGTAFAVAASPVQAVLGRFSRGTWNEADSSGALGQDAAVATDKDLEVNKMQDIPQLCTTDTVDKRDRCCNLKGMEEDKSGLTICSEGEMDKRSLNALEVADANVQVVKKADPEEDFKCLLGVGLRDSSDVYPYSENEPTNESQMSSIQFELTSRSKAAEADFTNWTVKELREYLSGLDIRCTGLRKADLVRLADGSGIDGKRNLQEFGGDESKSNSEKIVVVEYALDASKKSYFSRRTVKELRQELNRLGLDCSGPKPVLIARLEDNLKELATSSTDGEGEKAALLPAKDESRCNYKSERATDTNGRDYSTVTVKILRQELLRRGLDTAGRKADMIDRLRQSDEKTALVIESENEKPAGHSDTSAIYSSRTVAELRKELRELGLPTTGKKSELVERLTEIRDRAIKTKW